MSTRILPLYLRIVKLRQNFTKMCEFSQIRDEKKLCNYILFTKLPWPGENEGIFRSSSQAAPCSPVYHTRWRLYTVPFNC